METRVELAVAVKAGDIAQNWDLLLSQWNKKSCERMVAEIGNEEQDLVYEQRLHKTGQVLKHEAKGWFDVLTTTGLGYLKKGDIEAYVVMVEGGRNHVGRLEGCKFVVELVQGGKSITKKEPVILEDELEITYKRHPQTNRVMTDKFGNKLILRDPTTMRKMITIKKTAIEKLKEYFAQFDVVQESVAFVSEEAQIKLDAKEQEIAKLKDELKQLKSKKKPGPKPQPKKELTSGTESVEKV